MTSTVDKEAAAGRRHRVEEVAYGVLRFVFGAILFTHGLPKVMHTSHGSMADPMAGSVHLIETTMHLPFATQLAVLVMILETVGAAMLAVGMWTRVIAACLVLEMIGISWALGPRWPWIDRGIEYPVLMGFLAMYIAVCGSGHFAAARLRAFLK